MYGLASLLIALFILKEAQGNGDFIIYLEASKLIEQGQIPYQKWLHFNGDNYGMYFYSPLWATLLIPLTHIPQYLANLIWLVINVFFVYRTVTLIKLWLKPLNLESKHLIYLFIFAFASSARFLIYNFEMLQMTIYVLWSVLESFSYFNQNQVLKGGALLALAINIKVLALVFIPYLIFRSQSKAVASSLVFFLIYLCLPAVVLGWDFNYQLHVSWWNSIDPNLNDNLVETNLGVHSLSALIPTLFSKTEGILELKRNLFNLPIKQSIFILNAFRFLLVLSCIAIFRWKPFQKSIHPLDEFKDLSYLFLLIPLLFPRQQKYAFFLVMPAQTFLIAILLKTKSLQNPVPKKSWILFILLVFSFILMTLSTDGIIGREFNRITQHFKLITYGALLLIPAMFIFHPRLPKD